MSSPLKVYKASAGSGKTFTLAVEYIKLLINNPKAYRHILAVTFTNKATAEMKERILSQLYGISRSLESSAGYFAAIRASYPDLDDEQIRQRARTALEMMLNDYSHFRIQTIDAFFQTILRGLARELELSGDVVITLDSDKLLEEAVDLLITRLTPTSKERPWIVEYIDEHLSNNKSWHIGKAIKDFAKNILSEEYQERGEKLRRQIDENNGTLLTEYRKTISGIENEIVAEASSCANRFFEIAASAGLGERDFFQTTKGVWGFFTRLKNGELIEPNSYVTTCQAAPEKLSKSSALSQSARNEIVELIASANDIREKNLAILNSCKLSVKRFHQLRLLNSIARMLKEENNRENRFLLAQTTFLLSKMITGNTSFIFEKIGGEIHHIFIDEFQDTSALQWKNFKVLLHDVISRNNRSLIVGDVKQSIYRWRNSDWSILNNLEKEFPGYGIKPDTLKVNRRSERGIIEFNNSLFTSAAASISNDYTAELGESGEELTRAYSDVAQEILPEKPQRGYVEVRMVKEGESSFEESVYDELMKSLRTLMKEKGVAPSDITILVRKNKEIAPIAERFGKEFPEYAITSDDAYLLSSSRAINMLVAALRYISNPDDRVNLAYLAACYSTVIKGQEYNLSELTGACPLPPEGLADEREELRKKPLYELLEKLINMLHLYSLKEENDYIYSFLDHAAAFLRERPATIEEFLEHWDDELNEKSIPAGESGGVRILSIHKSKGLEFHTVIIPFCTWELTGGGHVNTIWCAPSVEPFNMLSLLPIDFQKNMRDSIYKAEYNHEHLYQLVDNLNLLYVACTRAGKNLIIFSDAGGGRGDTLSKRLPVWLGKLDLPDSEYNADEGHFTYGEVVPSRTKAERSDDNPYTEKATNCGQRFVSYDNKLSFKQSRSLKRFLAQEKSEQKILDYIARGELLHELLSRLRTRNDLSRQVKKMRLEGLIATDKDCAGIEKLMQRALSHPTASDWFSGKYRLYNECTIIDSSGSNEEIRRPDRVMVDGNSAIVVDFKFGKANSEYNEQVKNYMLLLKKMGYTDVKGYLWYVYNNNIEEV